MASIYRDLAPWLYGRLRRRLAQYGPVREDMIEDALQNLWCRLLQDDAKPQQVYKKIGMGGG